MLTDYKEVLVEGAGPPRTSLRLCVKVLVVSRGSVIIYPHYVNVRQRTAPDAYVGYCLHPWSIQSEIC